MSADTNGNNAVIVTVCLGSSCHIRGANSVIDIFKARIAEKSLDGKVELAGRFCTGNCSQSVCVTIGNDIYSVKSENAAEFFDATVIPLT